MPQIVAFDILIALILLIAFLTETIVEFVKKFFTDYKLPEKHIFWISAVVGVVLAWLFDARLFEDPMHWALNVVGFIVIGLIASRGANYAHNWLDKLPRKGR